MQRNRGWGKENMTEDSTVVQLFDSSGKRGIEGMHFVSFASMRAMDPCREHVSPGQIAWPLRASRIKMCWPACEACSSSCDTCCFCHMLLHVLSNPCTLAHTASQPAQVPFHNWPITPGWAPQPSSSSIPLTVVGVVRVPDLGQVHHHLAIGQGVCRVDVLHLVLPVDGEGRQKGLV